MRNYICVQTPMCVYKVEKVDKFYIKLWDNKKCLNLNMNILNVADSKYT